MVSRTLRGNPGAVSTTAYDALGRPVRVELAGSSWADPDTDYAYDNFGRLVSAVSSNGHALTLDYDALGRKVREADAVSGRTMAYDLAGRRTRLTWADGFYVAYEHDVAGAVTAIRENGGGLLASFAYDDLGRRTRLTRGNGVVTNYGYDAVSRLQSLGLDLAGTARDHTVTFTHNVAGQVKTREAGNDAYAYAGRHNVAKPYAVNGLNQYTQAGSAAPTHDAKGNTIRIGGATFAYNVLNQLVTASAPQKWLVYGPSGLLESIHDEPGVGTRDDGLQRADGVIVNEITGTPGYPIQRRYVHGPGVDEPLVWYEGAGTGDKRWLVADERGSIVAVTDAGGNATAINTYDEYGAPAATNVGRFGYTGQAWLPELGLYDYKARMYAPSLGRFMQTDPIGYGDGLNWYNYVGGDPVNGSDPWGLQTVPNGGGMPDQSPGVLVEPDAVITGKRLPSPNLNPGYNTGPSVLDIMNLSNTPHFGAPGERTTQTGLPKAPQSICSVQLSGRANRGQTVNSRRAQVRAEVRRAMDIASRTGGDLGAAHSGEVGRNISRLAPNIGTWIRGGTSRADGNYLFGAVTDELGIPMMVATGVGDVGEFIDDLWHHIGPGDNPDEGIGRDSPLAREQMARGAGCPG